jgi:hypothetical protein
MSRDFEALWMGDISLPIYGYYDKWSGYLLKLVVLPDSRKAAPMGHVYLDLIAEYGGMHLLNSLIQTTITMQPLGIPMQLTTDKGPE